MTSSASVRLAIIGAGLAALLLGAYQQEGDGRPGPAPRPHGEVPVVFSGSLHGEMEPCGCTTPMIGGLARRGGWLAGLGAQPALVRVENGDLVDGQSRQDEIKLESIIEMLNAMKYDAVGLGEADLRMGIPLLRSLQTRFKGSLLSANLRMASKPARDYVVVTRKVNGLPRRVVVTSLLSMQFRDTVEMLRSSPAEAPSDAMVSVLPSATAGAGASEAGAPVLETPTTALRRLRPALVRSAETRVLLYHGPASEASALARLFPIFDLIVVAHEGDSAHTHATIGSTVISCSDEHGKRVGLARIPVGAGRAATRVTFAAITPAYPEADPVAACEEDYRHRVEAEDLLGQVSRTPPGPGGGYVGGVKCASCHRSADDAWKRSSHSRAIDCLVSSGHSRDPECVVCHTVGSDRLTGFDGKPGTAHLANVGCESCHGAGAVHSADPTMPMGEKGSGACVRCHVPTRSPTFDFPAFWSRISH